MNCEKFEIHLQECLDNNLDIENTIDASPELIAHSAGCTECAQLAESFKTLNCGIDAIKSETFDIDIVDRVVPLIEPATSVSPGTRFNWYKIAAIAACLAIVVTLGSYFFPGSENNNVAEQGNPVINENDVNQNQTQQKENSAVGEDLQGIESFTQVASELPQMMNINSYPKVAQTIEVLRPYYIYTQNLPGVRPVSSSLTITVDVLRRSMENQKQPDNSGNPDARFRQANIHWV